MMRESRPANVELGSGFGDYFSQRGGPANAAWRWNPAASIALTNKAVNSESAIAMPRENDLEGPQDQGGKHGGQKGMPKPEPKPPQGPDQGIVRDEQGQEQPRDKARAQQVHRTDTVGR